MGEFEKALEKYAKYVIQQARTNLTKRGKILVAALVVIAVLIVINYF